MTTIQRIPTPQEVEERVRLLSWQALACIEGTITGTQRADKVRVDAAWKVLEVARAANPHSEVDPKEVAEVLELSQRLRLVEL